MQDVCDQPFIEISPELATIFRKHFNKVYQLSEFRPLIVRYKSKSECIKHISERYETICSKNISRFPNDEKYVAGVKKMLDGAHEFCRDLEKLSHHDIDLIRRMTPYESLGVISDKSRKIETINGKPIKLEV
jgi:hypothetical protein